MVKVMVSLSEHEAAQLDERRGVEDRAVYCRRLLQEPYNASDVATHSEALGILTRLARDGKQGAAIALERALRADGGMEPDGELARLLRGDE